MNPLYADLPHIKDVVRKSDADDPMFGEIAQVLKEFGALDKIGVCLLHHHYPVKEGEVLLETPEKGGKELLTRPVPVQEALGATETMWRLREPGKPTRDCLVYGA